MPANVAISTLALLATCYALVLAAVWLRAVGRRDRREHVGHAAALLGVWVPGIALTMGAVLVGATLGLGWLAPLVPVLLPAAIATGLQLEVEALTAPDPLTQGLRVAQGVLVAIILLGLG